MGCSLNLAPMLSQSESFLVRTATRIGKPQAFQESPLALPTQRVDRRPFKDHRCEWILKGTAYLSVLLLPPQMLLVTVMHMLCEVRVTTVDDEVSLAWVTHLKRSLHVRVWRAPVDFSHCAQQRCSLNPNGLPHAQRKRASSGSAFAALGGCGECGGRSDGVAPSDFEGAGGCGGAGGAGGSSSGCGECGPAAAGAAGAATGCGGAGGAGAASVPRLRLQGASCLNIDSSARNACIGLQRDESQALDEELAIGKS